MRCSAPASDATKYSGRMMYGMALVCAGVASGQIETSDEECFLRLYRVLECGDVHINRQIDKFTLIVPASQRAYPAQLRPSPGLMLEASKCARDKAIELCVHNELGKVIRREREREREA